MSFTARLNGAIGTFERSSKEIELPEVTEEALEAERIKLYDTYEHVSAIVWTIIDKKDLDKSRELYMSMNHDDLMQRKEFFELQIRYVQDKGDSETEKCLREDLELIEDVIFEKFA